MCVSERVKNCSVNALTHTAAAAAPTLSLSRCTAQIVLFILAHLLFALWNRVRVGALANDGARSSSFGIFCFHAQRVGKCAYTVRTSQC